MSEPTKASNQWTSETIQRFWDYLGKRTDLHHEYFSYQVGRGLTNFLQHTDRLKPGVSVLDYGCGTGFLAEHLMARNVRCYGSDASLETVNFVNQKFQDYEQWMGAKVVLHPPAPYPDESFDVITCIETVEHLLEDDLSKVLLEIYRLLKPGGIALFTTPNNENLASGYVFCPFCQTEFHRVQHLRTFSEDTMKALLESHGFTVSFCRGIDLGQFQRSQPHWKDWSLGILYGSLRHQKNLWHDRIQPRPFPQGRAFCDRAKPGSHLCAIVERPKV